MQERPSMESEYTTEVTSSKRASRRPRGWCQDSGRWVIFRWCSKSPRGSKGELCCFSGTMADNRAGKMQKMLPKLDSETEGSWARPGRPQEAKANTAVSGSGLQQGVS